MYQLVNVIEVLTLFISQLFRSHSLIIIIIINIIIIIINIIILETHQCIHTSHLVQLILQEKHNYLLSIILYYYTLIYILYIKSYYIIIIS